MSNLRLMQEKAKILQW